MKFSQEFLEKLVPFLLKDVYLGHFKEDNFLSYMDSRLKSGFSTKWSLGGISNDCWGGSHTVSSDVESELTDLDDFLMAYFENVSYMQFRKISNKIETSTQDDSDYYGGSIAYGYKKLPYYELNNVLVELGLEDNTEVIDSKTFLLMWFEENNTKKESKVSRKI
ncbi:hypothetical protein GW796_08750 [archaeon]|nr:hypothetical protein [archaeon]NCQ51967.1 hypothetical protein [archaeon]